MGKMKKSKKQKEAYIKVPRVGDLHNFNFGYNNTVLTKVISVDEKANKFRVKALEAANFDEVTVPFESFNYAGRHVMEIK